MRKTVYVIPGFQEKVTDARYSGLLVLLKKYGFEVVPITISWDHKIMTDYVKEFLGQIKLPLKQERIFILGFSFGAMISFIASPKVKPEAQLLCSLSPYFSEDLPKIKKWWKVMIGKRRVADFERYNSRVIAQETACKTFLLAGTEEGPHIYRRATEVNGWLKNSELFLIQKAKHNLGQEEYLATLNRVLASIAV